MYKNDIYCAVVLCEYSKIFKNRIVTLLFDSKWIQLFEIFKYLSLIHNAVFGDCNGNYGRQKRDKLSLFLVPVVTVFGS